MHLARLVHDVFARTAATRDLTATQARLLCVLAEGPKTMTELAGILGVEKAAVTGLVDRIDRRGFVERRTVPGDRRACRIQLTRTGRTQARAVHEDILWAIDLLVSRISTRQRDQLRRTVTSLLVQDQPSRDNLNCRLVPQ